MKSFKQFLGEVSLPLPKDFLTIIAQGLKQLDLQTLKLVKPLMIQGNPFYDEIKEKVLRSIDVSPANIAKLIKDEYLKSDPRWGLSDPEGKFIPQTKLTP